MKSAGTSNPQFVPRWIEITAMSPGCFTATVADARLMERGRAGSRSPCGCRFTVWLHA